jgi:hypothetical protein
MRSLACDFCNVNARIAQSTCKNEVMPDSQYYIADALASLRVLELKCKNQYHKKIKYDMNRLSVLKKMMQVHRCQC